MALPDDKRVELEDRLNKIAPRLIDSPEQAGNAISNILRRYVDQGFHQNDLRLTLSPLSDLEHKIRLYERWEALRLEIGDQCEWTVFFQACVRKVDVKGRWRPIIIRHLGVDKMSFDIQEHNKFVPYEWLEKVMEMRDLDPDAYTESNNYAEVCEPLQSTLRSAGKSAKWIATVLTEFLANFNGKVVSVADVRFSNSRSEPP